MGEDGIDDGDPINALAVDQFRSERTVMNGLAMKQAYEVKNPDYDLSPMTGMARRH